MCSSVVVTDVAAGVLASNACIPSPLPPFTKQRIPKWSQLPLSLRVVLVELEVIIPTQCGCATGMATVMHGNLCNTGFASWLVCDSARVTSHSGLPRIQGFLEGWTFGAKTSTFLGELEELVTLL